MKKFRYSARTKQGLIENGNIESEGRTEAVAELQNRGLTIVSIDESSPFSLEMLSDINIGGVPITEKVVFMRQLAVMISAGLPLPQALEILHKQAQNPAFKKSVERISETVRAGQPLGSAMEKEEKVFDRITTNLVKAGEESGNLEEIFIRLADEWESKREFQSKVQGAMIYPVVIFGAMVLVVVLLMIFMIPTVSEIYGEFGSDLPLLTQVLIGISNFMISWWWLLLFFGIAGVFAYRAYYESKEGKMRIDELVLKLPVFGDLTQKIQLQQFTRLLFLLVKSGVPILDALELVSNSLSNYWFSQGIKEAAVQVKKGSALAVPLSRDKHFPIIVGQMIAVGEESGKLDEVLQKMSQYFEAEVKNITNNLTTLMEPLILLVMGGIIGILAVSVYLPMFSLSQIVG